MSNLQQMRDMIREHTRRTDHSDELLTRHLNHATLRLNRRLGYDEPPLLVDSDVNAYSLYHPDMLFYAAARNTYVHQKDYDQAKQMDDLALNEIVGVNVTYHGSGRDQEVPVMKTEQQIYAELTAAGESDGT